ncbi:MAG: imidazoleglycerol-phosphate dehydratase HisB [Candidatus Hydrogenedentota bacterium]
MREAAINRDTRETKISVKVNLDGQGQADVATGVAFMDHMIDHLARHSLMDIMVRAEGDLEIDAHHTVEDLGICLGKALLDAIGTAEGIGRYGAAAVPMDEALAEVALDVSGRPFLVFNAQFARGRVGNFDVELVEEFLRAFAVNARLTLHVNLRYSQNVHHGIEAIFKALARALRGAIAKDERVAGIPSTKGTIET